MAEDYTNLVAFDPGEMTGWAKAHVTGGRLYITDHGYDPWPIVDDRFSDTIDALLASNGGLPEPWHVIWEEWRLFRKHAMAMVGSDFPSVQAVGAMRAHVRRAQRNGFPQITLWRNAPAHKEVVDGWMGGTGYLPKSNVDHNRDAIRHLCYHFLHPERPFKGKPEQIERLA
jgi:hypothetical protein